MKIQLPGETYARIAIGAAALLLIGFVTWWVFIRPAALEQKVAEHKAAAATAEGTAKMAGDALETRKRSDEQHAKTDKLTQENDDAIHAAPGADAPIDPALANAGTDALCLRATYRDAPACAMRRSARRDRAAGADAGR